MQHSERWHIWSKFETDYVPDSTMLSYVEGRVLELHTNGTANCLPAMKRFPDRSPSTLGCINGEVLQRNRRLSKCLCKGSSSTNGESSGESVSEKLAPAPITWNRYASHTRMDHRLNHPSGYIAVRVYELGLRKYSTFLMIAVLRCAQLLLHHLGDKMDLRHYSYGCGSAHRSSVATLQNVEKRRCRVAALQNVEK
jgi:hypothetical protein